MLLPVISFALGVLAADTTTAEPDTGPIVDAVETVMASAVDPIRIALPPIVDDDGARRPRLEKLLTRALLDRGREEVVTPARIRALLHAQAEAIAAGADVSPLKPLAADHVLLARVVAAREGPSLELRLLKSETGVVVGQASARIQGRPAQTTARTDDTRVVVESVADAAAEAIELAGGDVHGTRVGIAGVSAPPGAAQESRVDRLLQVELLKAMRRRGFLVVEREQLDAAVREMGIGAALDEATAPKAGQLVQAEAMLLSTVAEAGDAFTLSSRLVSVETGKVLAAAGGQIRREGVVNLAAVEMRTPTEAALRSVVAPGWGQAYNGEGVKAAAFAVGGYGGLLSTVGLAVGTGLSFQNYLDAKPGPDLSGAEVGAETVRRRDRTNGLVVATGVAAGVTAVIWSAGVMDALLSAPVN